MKQIINEFINSIDTKLYSRIRGSMGDAECRRYLKEHLQKQLNIHGVVASEACKCERPLPYELIPFKCHNCKGEIKKSETECCPYCNKCHLNYDLDGSRLGWECKRLP